MTISPTSPDAADSVRRLAAIMAALRDPASGCPWDIEQDFRSIAPYTIEEAYEVADAIERDAMDELKGELGDLLLQVVFHAQMAAEAGHFTLADVAAGIADKMEARHPHVFGDATIDSAAAQTEAWEAMKAKERSGGTLDGVALGLPALMRAQKLQKRAARVGFDWPDASGPLAKIDEELAEIATATNDAGRSEEIGDLLFAVVNYARHLGVDAEEALRASNTKFERRFRAVETAAGRPLSDYDIDGLEALWQQIKRSA